MLETLSIGDLARRTGLSPATVRMWETRHGFPVASRLLSGHRRYSEADVTAVRAVVEHRDAGMRLETAISHVQAARQPVAPSVFAQLRATHPELEPRRLHKPSLTALSRAFEDEFASRGAQGSLWGAFQGHEHYRAVQRRWESMAVLADRAVVLADFEATVVSGSVVEVALPVDAPMLREWVLVVDGPQLSVALGAWEVPGEDGLFEAIWTADPHVVHEAARVCASVARSCGADVPEPAASSGAGVDIAAVTAVFNRVASYLDHRIH